MQVVRHGKGCPQKLWMLHLCSAQVQIGRDFGLPYLMNYVSAYGKGEGLRIFKGPFQSKPF